MTEETQAFGELEEKAAGTASSYFVDIIGIEHGRWQGHVEHVESGHRVTFASLPELLSAIGRAL